MRVGSRFLCIAVGLLWQLLSLDGALAQPFGVELHNTMMPASGGMGGVSIARPQDQLSAINGNPATLTHFKGLTFTFGSGWAEPTISIKQTGNLLIPGVTPFAAKSHTPGSLLGNIGISQQMDLWGIDSTIGIALTTGAGGGTNFVYVPASNGTSSELLVLQSNVAAGFKLTDRLSAGANLQVGSSFYDGPFVGISSTTVAYGVRGTIGLNYDVNEATSAGIYYQTKQHFDFVDAVRIQLFNGDFSTAQTVRMDLPDNVGFGIANRKLMEGRLLLGADVLFKNWQGTDLYGSVYQNQWVFQFGTQYSHNKWRLRGGYEYAQNPLKPTDSLTVGGVTLPGGLPATNYVQAQLAIINQNRITGGIGRVDVIPGVDFDMFAGGMFNQSQDLGPFTNVSVASYWLGAGITWRPGPGRCETSLSK